MFLAFWLLDRLSLRSQQCCWNLILTSIHFFVFFTTFRLFLSFGLDIDVYNWPTAPLFSHPFNTSQPLITFDEVLWALLKLWDGVGLIVSRPDKEHIHLKSRFLYFFDICLNTVVFVRSEDVSRFVCCFNLEVHCFRITENADRFDWGVYFDHICSHLTTQVHGAHFIPRYCLFSNLAFGEE